MPVDFLKQARELDSQDELAQFRPRFFISDPNLIYLDGNSLGRLPKTTTQRLQEVIRHEWGDRLIRSWNESWLHLSQQIGDKIAKLLGASEGEIILADSTSVNLFKLAMAAMIKQNSRHKILTDDMNFPTDIYILQSICRQLGKQYQVEVIPSEDGIYGPAEHLLQAVDQDTAILSLSLTTFKSGYTYDAQTLTQAAHEAGAFVLWDLSHAAGVVPISLNKIGADLAVGCTYKYLNGGPGSPAFLYVRKDLQQKLSNPISGWMGHENIFDFDLKYMPATGIRRFLSGTQPILSTSAVEGGVDIILEAGIDQIRAKSIKLSQFLIDLWQAELAPSGFQLQSPSEANWRGSHISLGHADGHRIDLALINEMDVIPDFREPDNIRLGLSPLYTSFFDVYKAVSRMKIVMDQQLYKKYSPKTGSVT